MISKYLSQKIIFLGTTVFLFSLAFSPAFALTPTLTPTAAKSLSPTPTTKKSLTPTLPSPITTTTPIASPSAGSIEEKVKEIRETVKEKVQEKIQEIKDRVEKKGYVGILKEMTDSTLTLETLSGEKLITVDKEAKIIGANKKDIKLKDLEIDQKLICMGTLDENNILVAKRIVVVPLPTKPLPKKNAFIGRIFSIDLKTKVLSLINPKKASQKFQVKVVDKITIFNPGSLADLKEGDLLIIVTSQEKENDTPTALLIKPF